MIEVVLSSSSDSVDKAIDEYTNPRVVLVIVIAVMKGTLQTSMSLGSLESP